MKNEQKVKISNQPNRSTILIRKIAHEIVKHDSRISEKAIMLKEKWENSYELQDIYSFNMTNFLKDVDIIIRKLTHTEA
jgi:hypothetical protein